MAKKLFLVMCMTIILAANGCDWWPHGIEDRAVFDRERRLWLEQNIQNYSFETTIESPKLGYGGHVFVQDGTVIYCQI